VSGALNDVAKLFRPASTGLARATPVFAIVGGTLDTVTGAMDASNAYEENGWTGRTGGHTLRSAGGALAVLGGILMIANPVGLAGAVVILVGVAAQFAGSWVVDASSEIRSVLRGSPWGRAEAALLTGTAKPDHLAPSRAVFRFSARMVALHFGPDGPGTAKRLVLRVEVKEDVAKWLPAGARWVVEARGTFGTELVTRGWALERRTVPSPTALDGKLVMDVPVAGVVLRPEDTVVHVAFATITLAPCADERHHVTKRLSDEFNPDPLFGDGVSALAR
jgi:hypothetical protein